MLEMRKHTESLCDWSKVTQPVGSSLSPQLQHPPVIHCPTGFLDEEAVTAPRHRNTVGLQWTRFSHRSEANKGWI